MIDPHDPYLSVRRQCALLELSRATYYYQPVSASPLNLELMRQLDEQYMRTPFYGWPRMTAHLQRLGYAVNPKRVRRLLRLMGLQAIYPKPRTTQRQAQHRIYPYLLRDLTISHPDQVWSSDITYLPLRGGFLYLVAVMDWFSRYVLVWRLSNTLDGAFCVEALQAALQTAQPQIFNSDQGSQFTAGAFTATLQAAGVQISMDGRGRAFDNIFIERLWRSLKYEDVYPKEYASVAALEQGLQAYFTLYNEERLHQSLAYRTPAEVYFHKQTPLMTRLSTSYAPDLYDNDDGYGS